MSSHCCKKTEIEKGRNAERNERTKNGKGIRVDGKVMLTAVHNIFPIADTSSPLQLHSKFPAAMSSHEGPPFLLA